MLRYLADRQHVEVVEVVALVQAEVIVADVSSADDRGAAVGDQQLVVHAGIEPLHLRDHFSAAGKQLLLSDRHQVVHDQPHADAAMRGEYRPLEYQPAGRIRIPEVGHDIERRNRRVDQGQSPGECLVAAVEQVKPGVVRPAGRMDTAGHIGEYA